MEAFNQWWSSLQALNQWFFMAAAFFSVFFLWQLIMAMLGLGGGSHDLDTQPDQPAGHDAPNDAHDTVAAFKMISLRSLLAFFTLFTWAGGLYLSRGMAVTPALTRSLLWGLAAMALVSALVALMRRMTETGNVRIASCVGAGGTVYLDIPVGGDGEIRVLCSGVMTHLRARNRGGAALKAGAKVRVLAVTGPNSVEVEPET